MTIAISKEIINENIKEVIDKRVFVYSNVEYFEHIIKEEIIMFETFMSDKPRVITHVTKVEILSY